MIQYIITGIGEAECDNGGLTKRSYDSLEEARTAMQNAYENIFAPIDSEGRIFQTETGIDDDSASITADFSDENNCDDDVFRYWEWFIEKVDMDKDGVFRRVTKEGEIV